MNPGLRRSRFSRRNLILLTVLFVCVLVAVVGATVLHNLKKPAQTARDATFTPAKPVSTQATATYRDASTGLSFTYPLAWKNISSDPSSGVVTLTYAADGGTYRFNVSPPGQINPEGVDNLAYTITTATYGGREYTRAVWTAAGVPFYVTAIPQQISGTTYYVLSMQIPPQNTQQYLDTFDQIAGTLQYNTQ